MLEALSCAPICLYDVLCKHRGILNPRKNRKCRFKVFSVFAGIFIFKVPASPYECVHTVLSFSHFYMVLYIGVVKGNVHLKLKH
jgi:hypothetical protein